MDCKTIIFDLGGVILPLDVQSTIKKILALTGKDVKNWIQFGFPHDIIQKFELGKISERTFFEEMKDLLEFDDDIYYLKDAWNSMLLDIPKENIETLKELSKQHQLILLSNTCETHIKKFEQMLSDTHEISHLEELFNQVYFSCRMGLRKPDEKIFQKIIKDNNIDLHKAIYYDDTLTHIESAKTIGLNALLYPQNQLLDCVLQPITVNSLL